MGSQFLKFKLLTFVLLNVALAFACTSKENGGREKAPPAEPTPPGDPIEPCLRLQDEEDADHDHEDGEADHDEGEADHDHDEEEGEADHDHDEEEDADHEDDIGADSDCGDPAPTSPSPSTDGGNAGGGGGDGGWNEGPGLEGCAADGKAWIAVKDKGPGVCGPDLVSWCCSEAEILNQFPSLKAQLEERFVARKDLVLYHCSYDGSETRFHWGKYGDDGMRYSSVYVRGAGKVGGTAGPECKTVTSADLGIPTGGGGDGDDTVPTTIGPLSDTSKAGLLAWAGEHPAYASKDAAIRDTSAHGRVKGFYSTNLKTSMTAMGTKHPVGSVALLELFDAADTLKGYALMAKGKDAEGAASWLFYKIDGAPDFESEPTAYGMGVESCAGDCHTDGSKDQIKRATLP